MLSTADRAGNPIARLALVAAVGLIAAVLPATSFAQPAPAPAAAAAAAVAGDGSVTMLIGGNGKAARAFADKGVKVRVVKPATKRSVRVTLPVAWIAVGRSATVAVRGGLRFKAGKRSVLFRALSLKLATSRATVSARVGKRRLPVLAASYRRGQARLNDVGVAAALESAKLRLTARAAKVLRAGLRLRGIPAGPVGVISIDARRRGTTTGGGGGAGPAGCNPAPNAPPADPATEPAPLARPSEAVAITDATIVWEPRESWIRYINGGEGTCVFDGAIADPKEVRPAVSTAPLGYSFRFPFVDGWYDPASGTAAVRYRGGVGFKWKAHGINFSAADPAIEINGGDSRGIFRFNGADGTSRPNKRDVLVELTPGSDQGGAPDHSFPDMPGTLPPGADGSTFASFYPPDAPFGTVSIAFTAPETP